MTLTLKLSFSVISTENLFRRRESGSFLIVNENFPFFKKNYGTVFYEIRGFWKITVWEFTGLLGLTGYESGCAYFFTAQDWMILEYFMRIGLWGYSEVAVNCIIVQSETMRIWIGHCSQREENNSPRQPMIPIEIQAEYNECGKRSSLWRKIGKTFLKTKNLTHNLIRRIRP